MTQQLAFQYAPAPEAGRRINITADDVRRLELLASDPTDYTSPLRIEIARCIDRAPSEVRISRAAEGDETRWVAHIDQRGGTMIGCILPREASDWISGRLVGGSHLLLSMTMAAQMRSERLELDYIRHNSPYAAVALAFELPPLVPMDIRLSRVPSATVHGGFTLDSVHTHRERTQQ